MRRLSLGVVEGWRGASFLLGLFFIWLAMASPVAALDHELLTFHMVQYLLLMTLAPPLIWLAVPVKQLSYGLPQLVRVRITRLFRSEPLQQLGRTLLQPKVCWLAAAGTLVGWHVPALFMFGLQSEVWHTIEQASFLITGLLFWCPVVRPWPMAPNSSAWSILLYLFFATLPCDILSGFLVFCDRSVYPIYSSSQDRLGFSALDDQELAAALM
jgi:cytochrome c oxidase assembly factor CtaG